LTGSAVTYVFSAPLSSWYPVHDYTITSKYVLYESGAVALQSASPTESTLIGRYEQRNGYMVFIFPESGSATATLRGDALEVEYDGRMQHSDYESAVYRRSQ
jgi:hypothetical protein